MSFKVRRYKLLKSNKARIIVRFTNRSCIIQKVAPGFNKQGDKITHTALYNKFSSLPCNTQNLLGFLEMTFNNISVKDTILDLGTRHNSKGSRLHLVIDTYSKFVK